MIPGCNGGPFSYIVRDSDGPDLTSSPDFKDNYVKNALLIGTSYISNAREVHSAIMKLISGNTQDKAIIKPHEVDYNGRLD